ncbi:MAG: Gfo/Idh/MocA family oxidoreductase [Candidatus Latescibacterota bacterium]|nr:Gfo/Idh/MocA family oxidoreductase [Candidatus Latescibacterota bacterium]
MLRAGFIGAGPRARSAHYPAVHRLPEVEMAGICELDEQRMREMSELYAIKHSYSDHRQLLDEVDPDIIYCVMNEKWLLEPAMACVQAGKHLFIEKPPGANSDETRQLLAAAEQHGVWCMVGLQRRFAAVTREALRHLSNKGCPVSLATTTFNKKLFETGEEFTTTLWNDVVHVVDLLRYLSGGEPEEVTAYRDAMGGRGRNVYTALVRFDNGASGVVMGNRASGGRVLKSELHGVGLGCYMSIPEGIEIHEDNQRQFIAGWEVDGVDEEDVSAYEGTLTMHQHFVECVTQNQQPLTDLRDVIHSIELVDQIEGPLPT